MIDYQKLFEKFCEKLATTEELNTSTITSRIKKFFHNEFSDQFVLPKEGEKAFLVDLFVSSKNPHKLVEDPDDAPFETILVVESELGGSGGGSQKWLRKNVLEDFAKLLVINSEYKILIFTSLPYKREVNEQIDYIEARVKEIQAVYENVRAPGNILLIHLEATPQKTGNNHPTNPKISLKAEEISGFLLSKGMVFRRLPKAN